MFCVSLCVHMCAPVSLCANMCLWDCGCPWGDSRACWAMHMVLEASAGWVSGTVVTCPCAPRYRVAAQAGQQHGVPLPHPARGGLQQ